jgi:hypothetical protein
MFGAASFVAPFVLVCWVLTWDVLVGFHHRYGRDCKRRTGLFSGMESGWAIRLTGEGESPPKGAGPNVVAGDVIVEVRVAPSAIYEREGDDVVTHSTITFVEALLGTTIKYAHGLDRLCGRMFIPYWSGCVSWAFCFHTNARAHTHTHTHTHTHRHTHTHACKRMRANTWTSCPISNGGDGGREKLIDGERHTHVQRGEERERHRERGEMRPTPTHSRRERCADSEELEMTETRGREGHTHTHTEREREREREGERERGLMSLISWPATVGRMSIIHLALLSAWQLNAFCLPL